jgi:protein-tyrosine kinase
VADPRSKFFDVLRTQVLQSMDRHNWHVLAVTSPTEGCGKTFTAVNLALSIARQPERSTVLVDLDLQRPKVAGYLGLRCEQGVVSMLAGRTTMQDSMVDAHIGGIHCPVLPAEARSIHSSELIASRAFRTMLEEIKTNFPAALVILDLPPVMSGDDVLSIMPYVDGFLLVAAVGSSTVSDIREGNRYLHSAEIIRIVLNKAAEQRTYYG